MRIFPETTSDRAAIFALTQDAFKDHPHSQQTEGYIIDALREAGALTLSLTAWEEGRLVGHIAFSPVTVSDGAADWYGLGPVSVLPARQGCGIGVGLVREGLARLKALGAAGCVVLGDPAYYARFGFTPNAALRYPDAPAEYFMALVFTHRAQGEVRYDEAFSARAPQV